MSTFYKKRPPGVGCGFCRKNSESAEICLSHQVKDQFGRVSCPQLFKHTCDLCGATGYEAHTRSYCPMVTGYKQSPLKQPAQPQPQILKPVQPQQQQYFFYLGNYSNNDNSGGSKGFGQQQPRLQGQNVPPNESSLNSGSQLSVQQRSLHLDQVGIRNMGRVSSSRYNSAGKLRRSTPHYYNNQNNNNSCNGNAGRGFN